MTDSASLLVIGGGPAAMAAAKAYREHGGAGSVVLVCDEHRAPYRRPPLTKEFLRGELALGDLPIESDDWFVEQQISLARTRVVSIDLDGRTASLEDGRELAFDQLLLATGSAARRIALPGADHPQVATVRTVADIQGLLERVGDGSPVTVVGSGFIGCEITASLSRRKHPVTMLTDEPQPLASRLGAEVGSRIADWLRAEGAVLRLGAGVEAFEPAGAAAGIETRTSEGAVPSNLAVLAAGALPRLELARDLGLDVSGGGFEVDASMRTTLPGVFAAGDACVAHHPVAGRSIRSEHWGDALAQGEVAGIVAAGGAAEWDAVPGFWSTIGDHTLKQAAWGLGHDAVQVESREAGAFVARYYDGDELVGVLTHNADDAYEAAQESRLGHVAAGK
jgi:3-phenylpropionate/trans-cinnamate dioxygenase ferredoxin reductase subunit